MTVVGHTSRSNMSRLICLWMAHVAHFGHRWWPSFTSFDLSCWYYRSSGVSPESFFFPFAFVKKGRERTKILKIILEAHQSCNNNITDIVGKISRRWIQWHLGMLSTVNKVCHTRCLKANESRHIWTARVSHSDHRWWSFFMSLDLSRRDLSKNIYSVFIGVLIYLHRILFFSFLIFLLLFYHCKFFQWCFLDYFFGIFFNF
jgi:hypothetical protein